MASTITLKRTGAKMPLVGFGLWKVTNATCADTVYKAIKEGYRLFDAAMDYGNEKEAGEGVARAIKDGVVKREDLWITSKLWNSWHEKHRVEEGIKKSLSLWGLDYFDLYLVHFPVAIEFVDPKDKFPAEWWGLDGKVHPIKVPFQETWTAMEDICDKGLAKNIGLSNASGALIHDVLQYARIEPQVLQVEIHPYLTQDALVKYAQQIGIAITAYSSFGPQGYIELGTDKGVPNLLELDSIASIAQKHGKTPAQVILRWATQRGLAIIPKSNSHDRLVQNLAVTTFELSEGDMAQISSLNINLRLNDSVEHHPEFAIFA